MSIGRHILGGFDGFEVSPIVRELIEKHKILGFTLFKNNIQSADQLVELTTELKARAKAVGYDILLAVDQEGGRVERLPRPFHSIRPMQEWADLAREKNDGTILETVGKLLALEVKSAGFQLDFTPVADINLNPDNPIIGNRAFGETASQVVESLKFFLRGMKSVGVLTCHKHFPGHGYVDKDSHLELPVDLRQLQELKDTEILPYQALIQEGMIESVMTAHVQYPNIDDQKMATLSPFFIDELLRKELGFNGVVFSDDLLMKAIADHFAFSDVTKKFLMMGGDAVLICQKPEASLQVIEELSLVEMGTDSSQWQKRLDLAKSRIEAFQNGFRHEDTLSVESCLDEVDKLLTTLPSEAKKLIV